MTKPSIIRPVSEDFLSHGINFMLYGDPGVGKTPLIATGDRTLILDADEGTDSAALSGSKADRWPVESWVDLEEAYEYLRHEQHGYKWVWLDSISIGQDRLLEGIMIDLVAEKSHRKVYLPDKGEYGQNMNRMKQWVRHMVAQPFNFGITAHPFRYEDEVSLTERIMPWVQGRNMSPTICGYMNLIGYLVVKDDGERRMYVKTSDLYYAKDRFQALGGGMINPTIPKIEAAIMKRKEEADKIVPIKRAAVKKAAKAVKAVKK